MLILVDKNIKRISQGMNEARADLGESVDAGKELLVARALFHERLT